MTLESDIRDIKDDMKRLKWRPYSASRKGLYLMMMITMVASVRSCSISQDIYQKVNKRPVVQVDNVIGQEAPEVFYNLNGQRFYLEVDGKKVEDYVN